jgi:hypothetical protein
MNRLVRSPRTVRASPTPTSERASGRDERRSERLTLIEFSWAGQAGIQPVILVARTLLH